MTNDTITTIRDRRTTRSDWSFSRPKSTSNIPRLGQSHWHFSRSGSFSRTSSAATPSRLSRSDWSFSRTAATATPSRLSRSDWSFPTTGLIPTITRDHANARIKLAIKQIDNIPDDVKMITVTLQDESTESAKVEISETGKSVTFKPGTAVQTDVLLKKQHNRQGNEVYKKRLVKISVYRCCSDCTHGHSSVAKIYINAVDFLSACDEQHAKAVRMHLTNGVILLGVLQCVPIVMRRSVGDLRRENERLAVLIQWARDRRKQEIKLLQENRRLRRFVQRLRVAVSREPSFDQAVHELCRVREQIAFVHEERHQLLVSLGQHKPSMRHTSGTTTMCT